MHGNELESCEHDLCVMMHPFQAPQNPLNRLGFGKFGKNAQDGNDVLWRVPLSTKLMIGAGMVH